MTSGPFRWERRGDTYTAEWPGLIVVRATRDGTVSEIVVQPGAPLDVVEKLRNGAAVAFARSLAGKASLHASAVAIKGQALVCVGASGAGKSTLARVLCSGAAAEVLADDVAGIDEVSSHWLAAPTERTVWLHADEDTSRRKVAVPCAYASKPAPIRWVARLCVDDELPMPRVRTLRGAAAVAALLSAQMRFDPTPDLMKREIRIAAEIARQAHVFALFRPRLAPAQSVADALLNFTEAGST
jgi:hypothetical protein